MGERIDYLKFSSIFSMETVIVFLISSHLVVSLALECFVCLCEHICMKSRGLSFDLCGVECQARLVTLGRLEENAVSHRALMKAPQQWILHSHHPSTPQYPQVPGTYQLEGLCFLRGCGGVGWRWDCLQMDGLR